MIRTCLEFLLSRSLDDGTPPTGWLGRLLRRDPQLNRYQTESRQLDTLLRSSAAEQRRSMTTASREADINTSAAILTLPPQRNAEATVARAKNSGHSLAWLSGLAAAALVLIAWSPNWFRHAPPAVQAGEFSRQLTIVPGEVLRLLTRAAKTSQTQLPQLSPLTNLTLPAMPAWEEVALHVESPVREEIDFWQESWLNFKTRLPTRLSTSPQAL